MKIRITVELDTEVAAYNKHKPIDTYAEAVKVYTEVLEEAFYSERENGPVAISITAI